MDRPTYKPAGSVLSAFLDENLSAKAGKVSSFFKSWRAIAGDRLSSHSRVAEVENGIVIVEADHPSWIQLLQMRQEEMLASIRKGWPELSVRGIAFRLRKDAPPGSAPPPEVPRAEREPEDETEPAPEAPRRPTGPIKDARLSQAIEKLKKSIREGGKA